MKVTLISYSGRKSPGNCQKITNYIKDLLRRHEITRININDLKVQGCSGCDYECFNRLSCPHEDDVKDLYSLMAESDLVINLVPVYSAAPPSKYFMVRERAQALSALESQLKQVKKLHIIIGNMSAGGKMCRDIILSEDQVNSGDLLILESTKYKQRSTLGDLIRLTPVQNDIKSFLERHEIKIGAIDGES